jgi:hypothetical protein
MALLSPTREKIRDKTVFWEKIRRYLAADISSLRLLLCVQAQELSGQKIHKPGHQGMKSRLEA